MMQAIQPFLGNLDQLYDESPDEAGKPYFHPRFKNLGVVNMVVIREIIAPAVFRNAEQEITDIEVDGEIYARAVPNKFKYRERSQGLQVLRYLNAGGRYPQNRTTIKGRKPAEVFDLNALVFGDSSQDGERVYPIKAAVNYSDALSLQPLIHCIGETFHNRAFEDGSLFDAVKHESSRNIFSRHFLKPGTLLLQVLSTRGRLLPAEGLDHLLLCIGLAGAYGGQTSVTGTNIRTHLVGLYGALFEPEESSPYVLLKKLRNQGVDMTNKDAVTRTLHELLAAPERHGVSLDAATVENHLIHLQRRFEQDDAELKATYQKVKVEVGKFFNAWFTGNVDGNARERAKKDKTQEAE